MIPVNAAPTTRRDTFSKKLALASTPRRISIVSRPMFDTETVSVGRS
jgi:hypothetical protein